jgi:uncharacterized protein YaiE (UPF0345 family)
MNAKTIFGSVGLCALVFVANSGHSELIQTMNFHLTARVTTQVSTNGDTRMERMKSVRITTKEILDMLSKATGNDFHGATLVCVHRGQAYEVRRGDNVLADVSGFFTEDSSSEDVIDQDFNSTTGKDNYHGFWLRSITFDDQNGDRFSLSGMIEERYTAKTADAQGMQNVSDIETLNCTGSGTLDSEFALLSGTVLLSGKGVVPLNTF